MLRKGTVLGSISTVSLEDEAPGLSHEEWDERKIRNDITLNHLSAEEADSVYSKLASVAEVFSTNEYDIGRTQSTEYKIELLDNTPIYERPRRFPKPIEEEINKQCDDLHALGIIEPSVSPWAFPIVPIRKPDQTIRMCVDYRKLNKVIKADKHPIPNLTDSLYSLRGAKYFTCLDLIKGYYQVPLHESSKEITAFTTNKTQWQFKRLPFGLKTAPSAFQRTLQNILYKEVSSDKVKIYIDDILIVESDFESHVLLVHKVLSVLKDNGIKVKPSKCTWVAREVEFLGHIVSESGIRKTPKFVEAVFNYPRPQTVRDLQKFLGLINFQRKFVPFCSDLMQPLSKFTGKRGSVKLK
jgi:hypothetical protein